MFSMAFINYPSSKQNDHCNNSADQLVIFIKDVLVFISFMDAHLKWRKLFHFLLILVYFFNLFSESSKLTEKSQE